MLFWVSFLPKLCLEREQRVSVCPKRKHDDQHDRYGRCCHSLFDSTQKKGLETKSGNVSTASGRTACAEPLRPFKRNPSKIPQHPLATPELDYHLVRLGTNPIGSAAYVPLMAHLSPARGLGVISLQRALSLLGRTRGINRWGRASAG